MAAAAHTLLSGAGAGAGGSTTTTSSINFRPTTQIPTFPKTFNLTPRPNFSSFSSSKIRAAVGDGLTAWKSFYELLGIPEEGSFEDIKRAYKQKARIYHPDVCPPDRTEEYTRRFIEVQEAYETLSDPSTRALYDRDLSGGIRFAFGARKMRESEDGLVGKSEWKNQWQNQVSELKKKSTYKDSQGNMSWGARMRRQRNQSSSNA